MSGNSLHSVKTLSAAVIYFRIESVFLIFVKENLSTRSLACMMEGFHSKGNWQLSLHMKRGELRSEDFKSSRKLALTSIKSIKDKTR